MANSEKQTIIKDSIQYFTATMVGQLFGLARSIFMPVLFTPAMLGVWNLMMVVINYGGNAHLGILHGMNKLIPTLRGQGKLAEVEDVKDSAFWINAFLSSAGFLCIWCSSYFVPSVYVKALRITAVIVLLTGFFYYLFSLLRADNRFRLVSLGVGAISILSTLLVVTFAYFFTDRLAGALIGLAVANGLVVLFFFWSGRYHYAFKISGIAVKRSFITGSPLLILGLLDSVFLSIDRWMVASNFEATTLGYYALAIMASSMIGLVPGSINSVLYPKMLERFGANGGSEIALRSLVVGPERAIAAVMSIVIGGAVLVLPLFIRIVVPKYLPSIPLLGILISAAFFYTTAFIPGSFMVAVNRQKILIGIQIMAILLAVVLDFVAIKRGWGIIGIAWSTAAAYAVYGVGYMCIAAYFVFDRRSEIASFLGEIYGLFGAMVLGLIVTTLLVPVRETLGMELMLTSARVALFLVVLFPALWWSNRHGDLFAIAREMFPAYFNKSHERPLL